MKDRDPLLAALVLMALAAIIVSVCGCTVTTECVDFGRAGNKCTHHYSMDW